MSRFLKLVFAFIEKTTTTTTHFHIKLKARWDLKMESFNLGDILLDVDTVSFLSQSDLLSWLIVI